MAVATTELQEHLASIHACDEARTWAGDRTPQQAWDESPRADWLLWWAAKTETNSRQDVVRAACLCARRALRYVPPGELRPLRAIEAAERWADEPSPSNAAAAAWNADAAAARRRRGMRRRRMRRGLRRGLRRGRRWLRRRMRRGRRWLRRRLRRGMRMLRRRRRRRRRMRRMRRRRGRRRMRRMRRRPGCGTFGYVHRDPPTAPVPVPWAGRVTCAIA